MESEKSAPEGTVSPEVYRDFIKQLELQSVWLKSCRVVNHVGPDMPREATVGVEATDGWVPIPTGFDASAVFTAKITSGESLAAFVEVCFGLRYKSEVKMTETLYATFSRVNLPLNGWPYVREFLASTTGRFGWQPFTLPTLKRGVASQGPPAEGVPPQSR
jgi:hypothetical protein